MKKIQGCILKVLSDYYQCVIIANKEQSIINNFIITSYLLLTFLQTQTSFKF